MTCKDCRFRLMYQCDKHGELPWEVIEKDIGCKDYRQLEPASDVLSRWKEFAPEGTLERMYIDAMHDAIWIKAFDCRTLDRAIQWVYELADSPDVRSLRDSVSFCDAQLMANNYVNPWSPV